MCLNVHAVDVVVRPVGELFYCLRVPPSPAALCIFLLAPCFNLQFPGPSLVPSPLYFSLISWGRHFPLIQRLLILSTSAIPTSFSCSEVLLSLSLEFACVGEDRTKPKFYPLIMGSGVIVKRKKLPHWASTFTVLTPRMGSVTGNRISTAST